MPLIGIALAATGWLAALLPTIRNTAASKHILHVRRRNCNAPELHHNFDGAGGLDQGRSECRYAMACKLLSLDVATTIGSARRSASLEIRISSPS